MELTRRQQLEVARGLVKAVCRELPDNVVFIGISLDSGLYHVSLALDGRDLDPISIPRELIDDQDGRGILAKLQKSLQHAMAK